jgi:hypothetical protein
MAKEETLGRIDGGTVGQLEVAAALEAAAE